MGEGSEIVIKKDGEVGSANLAEVDVFGRKSGEPPCFNNKAHSTANICYLFLILSEYLNNKIEKT